MLNFCVYCCALLSCLVGTTVPINESEKYAGIYCSYIQGNLEDTKAPSGYSPFYISHYTRHGSRYLLLEEDFQVVSEFEKYDAAGKLSDKGKALLADMKKLYGEHKRMFSFLTLKGGKQQQDIAHRMARRFPAVFRKGGKIRCISSPAQRCIQSLANFTLSLSAEHNDLDFSIHSGHRYYDIIAPRLADSEYKKHYIQLRDSLILSDGISQSAVKECFLAPDEIEVDWTSMTHDIYTLCCAMQCQDYEAPGMNTYFTTEQLESLWRAENTYNYGVFCDTLTFGPYRRDNVGKPLLQDIITQIDFALTSGDRVADLRFGHDSGLTPLLVLIGLEGYEKQLPLTEAWQTWRNYEKVCMASNVQIVFYRHRSKEILVKILRNEEEAYIPALKSEYGPYYSWNNLREYLIKLL